MVDKETDPKPGKFWGCQLNSKSDSNYTVAALVLSAHSAGRLEKKLEFLIP